MSKVIVTIDTDNAAFEHGGHEVARLLRKSADEIEYLGLNPDSAPLFDANGNKVGEWRISE